MRDSSQSSLAPVKPINQTVEKLRHDFIQSLYRSGRLEAENIAAAAWIRDVWYAFSMGMAPSAIDLRKLSRPRNERPRINPLTGPPRE
ncbi:MAG: hypothetical protein VYA17_04250 [Pseudomonadota bacterium]|nr:hypothetical protein [Pseudomonadota bacterium]